MMSVKNWMNLIYEVENALIVFCPDAVSPVIPGAVRSFVRYKPVCGVVGKVGKVKYLGRLRNLEVRRGDFMGKLTLRLVASPR